MGRGRVDNEKGPAILKVLETLTLTAGKSKPDLILWPEATTPWAIKGDANMRAWTEDLVARAGSPLMLGSIARQPSASDPTQEDWLNAVFTVYPSGGLQEPFYAKRKLVPFGEFVPLRPVLGWLEKVVPVGADFMRGRVPTPLSVRVQDRTLAFGPLLCYEDIFPQLARTSVLAGADVLVVHTNNGWFGEGNAKGTTTDPALMLDGTVYFRGTQTVPVKVDSRWVGQHSFYVQHGDWFIVLSGLLAAAGFFFLRTAPPAPSPVKVKEPLEFI